jgi:CcmD family protein
MQVNDTLPYVIAAYAVTWTVLGSYAAYLLRLRRRLMLEASQCE